MNQPAFLHKNRFVSLKWRTLIEVFMAALVSVAVCLAIIWFTNYYISNIYLSEERSEERTLSYVSNLQAYISDNAISSGDTIGIARWSKWHNNIHLFIFEGDEILHQFSDGKEVTEDGDSGPIGEETGEAETGEAGNKPSSPEKNPPAVSPEELAAADIYQIRFTDRAALISVVDFTERSGYTFGYVVSAVAAAIVFLVIVLVFQSRQTRAILRLSSDVRSISGENLFGEIRTPGNNELGLLAESVVAMRDSIVRETDEKQKAWKANSDLITSISHDIRTPLTALLGYLDLLQGEAGELTEEQLSYLRICGEKASQIKSMSDDLFLYFLAFNKSKQDIHIESYDAQVLLEQLLGDHLLELEMAGIHTDAALLDSPCRIDCDIELLRRVFDNLFGNILKYADPKFPVLLRASRQKDTLILLMENHFSGSTQKKESTRIGLKTCENIIGLLKGRFTSRSASGKFTVKIELPVSDL